MKRLLLTLALFGSLLNFNVAWADIKITPSITGSSTIKVKLAQSSGNIQFYKVSYENGTYKKANCKIAF
jgi:hypothetical protein